MCLCKKIKDEFSFLKKGFHSLFPGSDYRLKRVICEIFSWVESSLEKQYLVMRKCNNLCIDIMHRDKS